MGPGSHRGETLVRCNRPGVSRAGSRLLAEILTKRRTRRLLEPKISHPLPVTGHDAGRRIEVRQDTCVNTSFEKLSFGLECCECANIPQPLGREGFRITDASTKRD